MRLHRQSWNRLFKSTVTKFGLMQFALRLRGEKFDLDGTGVEAQGDGDIIARPGGLSRRFLS